MENIIQKKLINVLTNGELLLIVPPFASTKETVLGVHVLHGLAEENGVEADILYLNILLASIIGDEIHQEISDSPEFWRLGERIFARIAYGLPPLGKNPEACNNQAFSISGNETHTDYLFEDETYCDIEKYLLVEERCYQFVNDFTKVLAEKEYKIIGFSSSFQQTNCSVAIANELKKQIPEVMTLIGGSNCEGQMAQGIASLTNSFDYIFSAGECETSFIQLLNNYKSNNLPPKGIVNGMPLEDLDVLPKPDYKHYFEQLEAFGNIKPGQWSIGYEASRGCWWGQKYICTFCGFNGHDRVNFRYKNPEKVFTELKDIFTQYPGINIMLMDKVMPNSYHKDLIPKLQNEKGFPSVFYEQRTNLSIEQLLNIKNSRVEIQVGIESLSTGLLKLMNKGAKARQNIIMLRNATSVGISAIWNMLWGLPGDKIEWYEETLEIMPFISHLVPPLSFRHFRVDRFCEYFNHPEKFGLRNVRPWEVYKFIYPDYANTTDLGYRFIAEYESGAHDNLKIIRELAAKIIHWRKVWEKEQLVMVLALGNYVIYDSRGINSKPKSYVVDNVRAKYVMSNCVFEDNEHISWAIQNKLGLKLDGWYVSLVTANPDILFKFNSSL